jgi:heme/copper-type cytochrome/quinol oxidase subunit 2
MLLHFMNNGLLTLLMHLNMPAVPNPNPMPQQVTDPFTSPEFSDMAAMYGMSLNEFLNTMVVTMSIIFVVCLVIIFGLLLVVRAITTNRVERPGRDKKAARGLLLGVPGIALILMVYTALGLVLLKNPAGTEILRFLGM